MFALFDARKGQCRRTHLYVCAHDLGGYSVEVTEVADLDELYGHANCARHRRQFWNLEGVRWIVGIEHGTNAREARKGKLEKIESLAAAKVPRSSYISSAQTLLQPDHRA